jgi:hypothetical protein
MIQYISERLNETSTWRGLISILTGLGIKLRPDLAEAIVSTGLALMGLINVARKEKAKDAAPTVNTQVS